MEMFYYDNCILLFKLFRVFHWVRSNAPIIIHINLDRVLSFLTKDTHYRNFFEIGTGGGSTDTTARRSWEVKISSLYLTLINPKLQKLAPNHPQILLPFSDTY